MGERTVIKDLKGTLGPGPGGYSVDKQKQNNVSYSMGGRLEDLEFKKRNFAPGPGNYEIKPRESIPSMKFGSGSRTSLDGGKEAHQKPGPGAYAGSMSTLKSSPKFGFGSSTREGFKTLSVPGPGNYPAKAFTGRDGAAYSMGALTMYAPKKKEEAQKPGPGVYSPDTAFSKKREPAFKMGTEVRKNLGVETQRKFQTAPGQYDPMVEYTKMKAAGWRIGHEKRPGMVRKGHESLPGPNVYDIPSKAVEGPQVHLHAKCDNVDYDKKKNVPGPGTYALQNSPNTRHHRGAAFSLGTSQRSDLGGGKEGRAKPGPGMYDSLNDFKK